MILVPALAVVQILKLRAEQENNNSTGLKSSTGSEFTMSGTCGDLPGVRIEWW